MKRLLTLLCLLSSAGLTLAQGTLDFVADLTGTQQVQPNSSVNHARGTFHLRPDGFFEWGIALDAPWFEDTGGFFHGPAAPGTAAPALFDLGNRFIVGPAPGYPGGVVYGGNRILTAPEISDLLAGLWYVSVTSEAYPSGEVRGQILLVPEPSTWALLAGGGFSIWVFKRRKQMA